MAQSIWMFIGCIVLFGIAGCDFLKFVTEQSSGIGVDIALIITGVIGLLYCLSVDTDEKGKRSLKRIRLTRREEEILYHLYGLKYNSKVLNKDTSENNNT
ncbi:4152_t:CDS:2, partial [Cetraspora pellucida]